MGRRRLLFIFILFALIWQNTFGYDSYECTVGDQIEITLTQNHINSYYNSGGYSPYTYWEVDNTYLRTVSSNWQKLIVTATKATVNTLAVVKSKFLWTDNWGRSQSLEGVYYVMIKEKVVYVTSIDLNYDYLTLTPGQEQTLRASVYPSNATNRNVRWESQDTGVASINNYNSTVTTVTGVAKGETYIYCYATDGSSVYSRCKVKVEPIPVTNATVSSPINVVADAPAKQLSVSIYPSNATVDKTEWFIAEGTENISLTRTGSLTGKNPGTAKVYCLVNSIVESNIATVNISEPSFTRSSTSPTNNATDVSAFVAPSVTYSLALYQGDNYSGITLCSSVGRVVDGTAYLSGKTVMFKPSEPLEEQTNYTLTIPAKAVKNKWGTHYDSPVTIHFKTGDYTKLTLSASLASGFVENGSKVELTASQSTARIYYTTNGLTPSANSTLYNGAIIINEDMSLRAVAIDNGYQQSDVLSRDYIISNVGIVQKFPVDETPMFLYGDVIPFVQFSNKMLPGSNTDAIMLAKDGIVVETESIVNDSMLFIVPIDPLSLGCTYTVTIPADAVVSRQGEGCKATSWTFSTGVFATAISVGGPELGTAIKTNGSLWTWGRWITNANATDGSYDYAIQEEPGCFMNSDVVAVSSGYMHHALIKRDGSLWMWGRQYCSEFGNGSTVASAQPVKVMDGVKFVSCGLQNTAIVKHDGTLWMCGRNDQGQIDESYLVQPQYVMVAEDVSDATLNWGSLQIVKTDGTMETRVWDENIDNLRKPTKQSNFETEFEIVKYGWKNAVALKKDGSVWTWTDSSQDETSEITPLKIIEGRDYTNLEGIYAINSTIAVKVGEKAVALALPIPLTADYTMMKWTSSDNEVAEVDDRGVITGITLGTVTIRADIISDGGTFSKEFFVKVGDGQDDDSIEVIHSDKTQPDECHIFNLRGQLVRKPQKGVNIIQKGDGTAHKVLFK